MSIYMYVYIYVYMYTHTQHLMYICIPYDMRRWGW